MRARVTYAKSGFIDDDWFTARSTNLDLHRFLRNHEKKTVILARGSASRWAPYVPRDLRSLVGSCLRLGNPIDNASPVAGAAGEVLALDTGGRKLLILQDAVRGQRALLKVKALSFNNDLGY